MSGDDLSVVNIAAYRFAELTGLSELRRELSELARSLDLRGTILLSPEGINVFLAGSRRGIDSLVGRLREIPGCADLEVKVSLSQEQPFNRLLVKIKAEIIAFGVQSIAPARYTSRRLTARQLKEWLDEGRAVTLLDTRNNFEIQAGTFRDAVAANLDDFRHFPDAVARLPESLKNQTVVTFCTGGIRCEKAAPYLEGVGYSDVYQLEGGILKYFEECGGAHYEGECFVFDKRVALDPGLQPSKLKQCFACQAIVSVAEQASPHYVEGESCPHCYRPLVERTSELLRARQAALEAATHPLPGCVPQDNVRPLSVPLRFDGLELVEFLKAMRTHLSVEEWLQACADGRLTCRGEKVGPGRIMRSGERLWHTTPAEREPDVAPGIVLLHEDDAIVVVQKPAPLPMHPCGRFHRNSLSCLLDTVYAPLKLRPAHRLDADTSGVVVFSKSREAARRLQPQFETGEVEKVYLARVAGTPDQAEFECHLPMAASPGVSGVRVPENGGQPSSTRFRVLETLGDGTTLVEALPLTGRTNQIRAHLWELGLPICGDPIYLAGGRLGTARSLAVGDPPLCLHAQSLKFRHPLSAEFVRFEAPAPAWTSGSPKSSPH